MKILYIDPVSGISGDMMIGAFFDLGLPLSIIDDLSKISPFPKFRLEKKKEGVISGTKVISEDKERRISKEEVRQIFDQIKEERVRRDVSSMLDILLEAEAFVHGEKKEDVHFHELSDTIFDLLVVAKAMSYFGIEKVFCGPIPFGYGTIETSHGIIPNPPPLTLHILKDFPVYPIDLSFELVTPTGAAIVRHYASRGYRPSFVIEKVGVGFGSFQMGRPDILRLFLGIAEEEENLWVLETDVDDMNMEYIGAIADRIRGLGAREVTYFPIYMKKGRFGIRISVMVDEEKLEEIGNFLFLETTTFGIRMRKEKRWVLKREEKSLETPFGPVKVKIGFDEKGNIIKKHIEFEDVKEIADRMKIPFLKVFEEIKKIL